MYIGVLGLLVMAAAPRPWSADGHKIVCEIAMQEVNEPTRTKVRALISSDAAFARFADSCVWADLIRDSVRTNLPNYQRFARFTNSHFVNIPRRARSVDATDCTRTISGVPNPCVIDAIRHFSTRLKQALSNAERLESLKFLAHFVGDVHQPLHAGYQEDLGANSVRVIAGEDERSLHSVWDGYLIQLAGKPWTTYAQELQRDINPIDRAVWSAQLDPAVWATESFQIVEDDVYEDLGPAAAGLRRVDQRYYLMNQLTVERRLKQAGVRLARLLEQGLGS